MKQFFDLNEFLDHAWSLLTRGVVDKKSVAKNPTFSTISEDGFPTMRTVVLRRADRIANCLEIHTDIQTNKVSSLQKHNSAGLHFWTPKVQAFYPKCSLVCRGGICGRNSTIQTIFAGAKIAIWRCLSQ